MSKIFRRTFDVLIVIVIVLLFLYFILRLLGVAEIYKVKTGSMEEKIHAGDYILIYKKKDYKVGDIVTYQQDNYHITHRVYKIKGNKIITKGDANNTLDEEIDKKSVIGKVIYHGGILNFLIDFKFAIAGGLLGLYLISYYFDKKEKKE